MRTIANDLSGNQPYASRATRHLGTIALATFGAGAVGASLVYANGRLLAASLLLCSVMLAIAYVDARSMRIPDGLSLPSIPLGLLASSYLAWPDKAHLVDHDHVLGMLAGCLALWGVRVAYRATRKREGLGLGDVKLAAVAGAWVGIEVLSDVLLLACGIALAGVVLGQTLSGRRLTSTSAIPFGAALAPAIWMIWFRDAVLIIANH